MPDTLSPLLTDETGPIDPMLPAGPQVFGLLKGAILTMQLKPGQALSEPEIGGMLGVSRTPVREAFAQLRALHLVETRPSRGSFVAKLNAGNLREAQFLRETLEIGNVQRVIEMGISSDVKDALERNLVAQDASVRAADHLGFHALDDAFHALIADGTGFTRAAEVLHHEKAQLDRLRVISLNDPARLRVLHAEHSALFQAIIARDRARAMDVAKNHMRAVLDLLDSVADQNAAFFDPA
jgi:DNA-binding GntR family transcriptional regulator